MVQSVQKIMHIHKRPLRTADGFTVPELLLLILIIIGLSTVVLINFQSARAKRRDSQRVQNIDIIANKLETYHNEKDAYPATLAAQDLFGIEEKNLKDPEGRMITMHVPVENAAAAQAVANPNSESASDYLYIPYPAGCTNEANNCTGYILKSYIQRPTNAISNPYTKVGLSNN